MACCRYIALPARWTAARSSTRTLSAALWGEINIDGGKVREQNFDTMRILRINEIPEIDVHMVASTRDPGGMGEPATALVAPAVCNAIYAATGKRIRSLPIKI